MIPRPALLLAALVAAVVLVVAACGDNGGGSATTPATTPASTPASTPAATPRPSPSPIAEDVPHAPQPRLAPDLQVLGEGSVEITLEAHGDTYALDPLGAALSRGIDPPPCAAFVFAFTWQVRDPYPPEGVDLLVQQIQQDSTSDLGEGPSGEAAVGCAFIRMTNRGSSDAQVELRYAFAAQEEQP